MRILSWLRDLVADFLNVTDDEDGARAEQVRHELEELRALALLAVAQARRTELELRDALRAGPHSPRLIDLVPRLEEERGRARDLLDRYQTREQEEARRFQRAGEMQLAEEINARRRELREAVDVATSGAREEDLARMEDEARAEAYRLDVLDRLDADEPVIREESAASGENIAERARRLLAEPELSAGEE